MELDRRQTYRAAFHARVMQRVMGPRAVSANQLAATVGVSPETLSRWLRLRDWTMRRWCLDIDMCFVLPLDVVRSRLSELNTTTKSDGGVYWHLKILETSPGEFALQMPRSGNHLPLADYVESFGVPSL